MSLLAKVPLGGVFALSLPLILSALSACSAPPQTDSEATASESSAARMTRITFGQTSAEAASGGRSSFVLESTPDLVLHAKLASDAYEGETLLVRGKGPSGLALWSFPHVQKGRSLDVVLHVLGSVAAQRHLTGTFSFEVTASSGQVVAQGTTTFTSRYSGRVASTGGGAK